MKPLSALILILFLQSFCIAQTRTITGRIINSETQKPVYNAAVIVQGTSSRVFTNFLGYFQMELAQGYDELIISHVAYQASKIAIPQADNFSVRLKPTKQFLKSLNLIDYPKTIEEVQERSIKGLKTVRVFACH